MWYCLCLTALTTDLPPHQHLQQRAEVQLRPAHPEPLLQLARLQGPAPVAVDQVECLPGHETAEIAPQLMMIVTSLVRVEQLVLLPLVQWLHVVPEALPDRVPVLLGALLFDLANTFSVDFKIFSSFLYCGLCSTWPQITRTPLFSCRLRVNVWTV